MKVQDFGRFDGPVLLFGGPYSNAHATKAFAAIAYNTPAICTGDIVAYGANPSETVALMQTQEWSVIAGNCERQIAKGSEDCRCGFGANTICDTLSRGWYPFVVANVSEEDRLWMTNLPDIGLFSQKDRRYAVIHGGVTSISRFLWPSSAEADFAHEIAALETLVGRVDGIVAGHSGIAFHRRIGRHRWINAGVIGLPPHDGRPETRFARLEDSEVTFERLSYDHESAVAVMAEAGLTQGYHHTLMTGIWPSEDVLPPELRR